MCVQTWPLEIWGFALGLLTLCAVCAYWPLGNLGFLSLGANAARHPPKLRGGFHKVTYFIQPCIQCDSLAVEIVSSASELEQLVLRQTVEAHHIKLVVREALAMSVLDIWN